ncbi:hypothetical protein KCU71_g118, partial [Aureobasidium melanogenum]
MRSASVAPRRPLGMGKVEGSGVVVVVSVAGCGDGVVATNVGRPGWIRVKISVPRETSFGRFCVLSLTNITRRGEHRYMLNLRVLLATTSDLEDFSSIMHNQQP